jgi:hypothetical protein
MFVTSCRSLTGAAPLDLSADGVQGSPVFMNTEGQTLFYNFRAVEPGVLYRASDFNRARAAASPGAADVQPAAFRDGQLFEFLRSHNIHRVVSLLPPPEYYAEEGYFQFWTKRSGYAITTQSLPVSPDDVYGVDDKSGVHAAGEVLALLKNRKPSDGAVLVHGEAGKDAVGVIAAAYELARTIGQKDDAAAWGDIERRYLASNALAAEAPAVAAGSLERIRPQLRFIAQLF